MNPANIQLPAGFQLLKTVGTNELFLAPQIQQKPFQELPLIPVVMGYQANGKLYSTKNVPADAPAHRLELIA